MNSPWNRAGAFAGLLTLGALAGCGGAEAPARAASGPPIDPAQAEAELLGRDLADIVDRVMAYRSAHQNRLPSSLRQAGMPRIFSCALRPRSLRPVRVSSRQ